MTIDFISKYTKISLFFLGKKQASSEQHFSKEIHFTKV